MTRAEYLKLRGWVPVRIDSNPEAMWRHSDWAHDFEPRGAFAIQAERDLPAFMAAEARVAKLEAALREIAEAQVNGLSNVALFALEDK